MHKQGEIRKLNLDTNGQKKTPRRFIVKRSQERNPQQTVQKEKITMISSHPHQQEEALKSMVEHKERVASTQNEALKREREISLRLRQAILQMNIKVQQQQKKLQQNQ